MGVSFPSEFSKPREKLKEQGINALSDEELLALILQYGSTRENVMVLSSRLLFEHGGLNGLFCGPDDSLETFGVGEAKAFKLMAIREIIRRLPFSKSFKFTDIGTLALTIRPYFQGRDKEVALVLYLNRAKMLIRRDTFTAMSDQEVFVPTGEILKQALITAARFVLILHNHPSGDVSASSQDIRMTTYLHNRLAAAQIVLLDSVIVTDREILSMRENGMGPYADVSFCY